VPNFSQVFSVESSTCEVLVRVPGSRTCAGFAPRRAAGFAPPPPLLLQRHAAAVPAPATTCLLQKSFTKKHLNYGFSIRQKILMGKGCAPLASISTSMI